MHVIHQKIEIIGSFLQNMYRTISSRWQMLNSYQPQQQLSHNEQQQQQQQQQQVLRKVIWEERITILTIREWTRPLHVLLDALPTADESNHSATGTLHPHSNATCALYITLHCPIPPPQKKLLLS